MPKRMMLTAFVCANVMAGMAVPAAAECDAAWRAKCGRLPEPQRIRCLNLCPQKPQKGSGYSGEGSYGKAEVKKKNVPTVKPND